MSTINPNSLSCLPADAASNYNYYPNTMINLCVISYQDPTTMAASVNNTLGLDIVWGPVFPGSDYLKAKSLLFVAVNKKTNEYTVVIRGTSLKSLNAIFKEDLDIDSTADFNQLTGSATQQGRLSTGTLNGMNDLLALTSNNQSLIKFLQGASIAHLYVTGHSLGGTLTPPMTAYLNYVLYGGSPFKNIAYWSFAGLTSGNDDFANYFNSLCTPGAPYGRIVNPFDIAPLSFISGGKQTVENVYAKDDLFIGILDALIRGSLDILFLEADDKSYIQPLASQDLMAVFNLNFSDSWTDQVEYQHHSTTYQGLVQQLYPT